MRSCLKAPVNAELIIVCLFLITGIRDSDARENCMPDGNWPGQIAVTRCEQRNYKETDNNLNAVYKQKFHSLDNDVEKRKTLVQAERKWISARDRSCKEEVDGMDLIDSSYAMSMALCKAQKTSERIEELKAR